MTKIIAEIANAHQGSVGKAIALGKASLKTGADYVKFQVYFGDEFLVPSHPRYEHFCNQAFSDEEWNVIFSEFYDDKSKIILDIFGERAFDLALKHGIRNIKVHSSDVRNERLLRRVNEHAGLSLIISTGGCKVTEICHAVNCLSNIEDITLMHGHQAYPTPLEDLNLRRIGWLKQNFGQRCKIGFQDHVDAESTFAFDIPFMAVSMGAEVIEKHITFDREKKGVDYFSSLEPHEFGLFVANMHQLGGALGEDYETLSDSEKKYRETVVKQPVATRELSVGDKLKSSDITYKRVPAVSWSAITVSELDKRTLIRPIGKDCSLSRGDVKNSVAALIIARNQSKRLPGKALDPIAGIIPLEHLISRVKKISMIDHIVLCTTEEASDNVLASLAQKNNISVIRGASDDVLDRMCKAIDSTGCDTVLRITGDDIMVDPSYADAAIKFHLDANADYTDLKELPSGTEVEIFDSKMLKIIHSCAADSSGTEYLTTYVMENAAHFDIQSFSVKDEHKHDWRLTLDTEEDKELITKILEYFQEVGLINTYGIKDIVDFLSSRPELLEINGLVRQRSTPPDVDTTINWKKLLLRASE